MNIIVFTSALCGKKEKCSSYNSKNGLSYAMPS